MTDYQIKRNRIYILLGTFSLILITVITYIDALGYYFTERDTFPILWGSQIHSYKDILKIFSTPLGGGLTFWDMYRPISSLSYGIDQLIWGYNACGYHLTDIVIHSLNTLLVFWFALILFRDSERRLLCAWLSAILFSISPININLVPTITCRPDMIASFFLMLCLLSAYKSMTGKNHKRWYILSLLLGSLSVFSKESACVLPFILGFYCFIFHVEVDYKKRLKDTLKYAVPLVLILIVNIILHQTSAVMDRVYRIPFGLLPQVKSGTSFLFFLLDPISLLRLSDYTKTLIFVFISCGSVVFFLYILIEKKAKGFLELCLSDQNKCYSFLLLFIASFGLFFMSIARVRTWYVYIPNIAFTLFITKIVFNPFKNPLKTSFLKALPMTIIIYILIFSPLLTNYSAWYVSSRTTKNTIDDIKKAVTSRFTEKDKPTIYLVNIPSRFVHNSHFTKEESTIFANYSLVAWAKLSESNDFPYVEFISFSYIVMHDSPGSKPKLDYLFRDSKVYIKTENINIVPPFNSNQKGNEPIKFKFADKGGELTFNRSFRKNELLLLFNTEASQILDADELNSYINGAQKKL